ncbi:MAG: CheR family methyltransferase [Actinomycetota bacterium]
MERGLLLEELAAATGFELRSLSRDAVERAVRRRIQEVGGGFEEYLGMLRTRAGEAALLSHRIFLNYTAFFRDESHWRYFAGHVVPMLDGVSEARPLRIWSAGCASGEEPYTLAMVMAEAFGARLLRDRVTILATDIDEEALEYAERASFTEDEVSGVITRRRRRYLIRQRERFAIHPDLKAAVRFELHDLAVDPPPPHLDVIVCRHTLMYFDADTQASILAGFSTSLGTGRVLFLEATDGLAGHEDAFALLFPAHPIFVRVG